jgi:RNA polymerase sigma-70 factor (ECF subfamily)
MSQFQLGTDAAFEQLVRRWEQPMLGFFCRMTGDVDTAEDLRQDVFVRLYVHKSTYRGDGTFRAWLYRLATNVLHSHHRRARVRPGDAGAGWNHTEAVADVPAKEPSPGDNARSGETTSLVRELLDDLSPLDRQALVLRFFEGLRYGEIARAMDIAESSAKSRVYRAVERLRSLVARRGLTADEML